MTTSDRQAGLTGPQARFTRDFPTDPALGPLTEQFAAQSVLDACCQKADKPASRSHRSAPPTGAENAVSTGRWQHAEMIEALYHPGRYFRAAYAFLTSDSVPGRRVWPEGDLVYVHAPVRRPMSRRGELLHVGDAEAELYRFPNDRRLRGLRKFAGQDTAVTIWQGWLDTLDAEAGLGKAASAIAPETLQRHLLRYVPEQKWVVRLRAEPAGRHEGKVHKRRITVRAGSPENCVALYARYVALRRYYKSAKPVFHTARVIGHDPELGLLAVKWAHGDDLVRRFRACSADDVCRDVVAVVRAFHQADIPNLPDVEPADLRRSIEDAVTDLSATCPSLRGSLGELGVRLGDHLNHFSAVPPVTLHNDLHWKQFLFDASRITLLDMERMSRGDPLIDVANLVTQVRMIGHRPEFEIDQATADGWAHGLLERWQMETGRVDQRRYHAYCACSMLNLARGMMRHLRTGWRELANTCVELAHAELAGQNDEVAET